MGLGASAPAIPGIPNLGLTCYINAVVQSLAACPRFVQYVCRKSIPIDKVSIIKRVYLARGDEYMLGLNTMHLHHKFMKRFSQLIALLSPGSDPNKLHKVSIKPFVDAVKLCFEKRNAMPFELNDQQDPHEFIQLIFEILEQRFSFELILGNVHGLTSDRNTCIENPFRLKLIDERKCNTCGVSSTHSSGTTMSNSVDQYCQISISPMSRKFQAPTSTSLKNMHRSSRSLRSCLDEFFEAENVENFKCGSWFCKSISANLPHFSAPMTKKISLKGYPNILCIHIKRQQFDATIQSVKKDTSHILFDKKMTLESDWVCNSSNSYEKPVYTLQAVVVHHDLCLGLGHYTSYRRVSNPFQTCNDSSGENREKWLLADDESVRSAEWSEVQSCEAYMLFYEKKRDDEEDSFITPTDCLPLKNRRINDEKLFK